MRWYAVLAVLVLLGATPASAQHVRDHVRSGRVQPLDRILPGVREVRPGTFYDAEGPFEGPDGRMHYRLKWMTPSGRIIWLDTDARTGRVLGEWGAQRRPVWEQQTRPERRRYAPQDSDHRNRRNNWRDERRYRDRDRDDDGGRRFERDRGRSGGHDWRHRRDRDGDGRRHGHRW